MRRSYRLALAILAFGLGFSLVAPPMPGATTKPAKQGKKQQQKQQAPAPTPTDTTATPTPVIPIIPPAPVDPVVTLSYDNADGTKSSVKANRDALAVLASTLNTYSDLKGLELSGTESTETGSTGKLIKITHKFTFTWFGPNFFKAEQHEDDSGKLVLQAGSTGKDLYSYDKLHETYSTAPAPEDRMDPAADRVAAGIFNDATTIAGLPMVFMVAKDPKMTAIRMFQATKVELGTDTPVGDTTCKAIKFTQATGTTTLLVDPKTHLLRRVESSGTDPAKPDTQINRAYDYALSAINGDLGAPNFAWTPPATAKVASTPVAATP